MTTEEDNELATSDEAPCRYGNNHKLHSTRWLTTKAFLHLQSFTQSAAAVWCVKHHECVHTLCKWSVRSRESYQVFRWKWQERDSAWVTEAAWRPFYRQTGSLGLLRADSPVLNCFMTSFSVLSPSCSTELLPRWDCGRTGRIRDQTCDLLLTGCVVYKLWSTHTHTHPYTHTHTHTLIRQQQQQQQQQRRIMGVDSRWTAGWYEVKINIIGTQFELHSHIFIPHVGLRRETYGQNLNYRFTNTWQRLRVLNGSQL